MAAKADKGPRVVLTGSEAAEHLTVVSERACAWADAIDAHNVGPAETRGRILDLSLFLVGTGQTYKAIATMLRDAGKQKGNTLGGYRQGLLDAAKLRGKLPADGPIAAEMATLWDTAPLREFGSGVKVIREHAIAAGLIPSGTGRKVATMTEDVEAIESSILKMVTKARTGAAKRAKRPILGWNVVSRLVAKLQGVEAPAIVFAEAPAEAKRVRAKRERKAPPVVETVEVTPVEATG